MRYSFAPLALAALSTASPMPQGIGSGVTSAISPSSSAPAGCSDSYSSSFQIQVVNVTSSSKVKRANADGTLVITLNNGVLKDQDGRTGYIASNSQFQFDSPPQAGAIYTAGFSVCSNGSLAIGGDAVWKQCLTHKGSNTYYDLYDENGAGQCSPIYIDVLPTSGSSAGATTVASQQSDGQVTATPVASQQTDGQVTESPVATGAVSQISDGQIQASSAVPVTQISDGQIQASTAAPVTQLSDGQPQAPVTTSAVAPVTQLTDGQPQAPATTSAAVVSQIGDGQPQAPVSGGIMATTGANGTVASPTASVQMYTGAAMPTAIRGEFFGLAAGVLAVAML